MAMTSRNPAQVSRDSAFLARQRSRSINGLFNLRTSDDRGNPSGVFESSTALLGRRGIRNAYLDVLSRKSIHRVVLWGLGVVLVVSLVAALSRSVNGNDAPAWVVVPIFVWIAVLVISILRSQWRASVAAALHVGACPSCNYALRGLPSDRDGCVMCPECGASWILPRDVQTPDSPLPKTEVV